MILFLSYVVTTNQMIEIVLAALLIIGAACYKVCTGFYRVGHQIAQLSTRTSSLMDKALAQNAPITSELMELYKEAGGLRGQLRGIRHEISTIRSFLTFFPEKHNTS